MEDTEVEECLVLPWRRRPRSCYSSGMEITTEKQAALNALVKMHGLSFLTVFGSLARGATHAESDVDIGYRATSGNSLPLADEQKLQGELEKLLARAVDLRSLHTDNPYFLYSVTRAAHLLAGNRTALVRLHALAYTLRNDARYSLDPIRKAFANKRL